MTRFIGWSEDRIAKTADEWAKRLRGLQEKIDAMPPFVKLLVSGALLDRAGSLLSVIEKAESPIELLMGSRLAELADNLQRNYKPGGWFCDLLVQEPIEIDGKQYRPDFILWLQDNVPYGGVVQIVVECDGHDYHERTKQQAARDRKRDRAMQAAGYIVLRFTGSEIWNDPTACVQEVERVVRQITRPGAQEVATDYGNGTHPEEADQPVGAGQQPEP